MTSLRQSSRRLFLILLLGFCVLAGAEAQVSKANGSVESASKSTPVSQAPEGKKEVADENDAYRHSAIVQKFGGMLGMGTETAATTFEVLNFAILALVVGGFLLKALPKTFRSRTETIQKDLVQARTATEEASARLNSVEERLSRLDGQIAEMRAQAERDSAGDEKRFRATVEDEKNKILASADQEIAAASLQAQRQLQQYAAELAIEQAARKLVVSAETDRLLVQGFVRRLGGDETKGGEN